MHLVSISDAFARLVGRNLPTTAVSILMIRSSKSFFQVGQFSGSRGDSLGCGTSTMSLLRPLACFKREVSRPADGQ